MKQMIHFCSVIVFTAMLGSEFLAAERGKILQVTSECNWTNHDFFRDFVTEHFSLHSISSCFGCHCWVGKLDDNVLFDFSRYLRNLLSAIGISFCFRQINQRINCLKVRILPNEQWNDVSWDYKVLCELLKFVDKSLDEIILLASLNNSYLSLVHLLNILACDEF